MNRSAIINRIKELKDHQAAGQLEITRLQAKEAELTNTLQRIAGAIEVLEEMLKEQEEL